MHPVDCPTFEYADHPDASDVLRTRNEELLNQIGTGQVDARRACTDTRPYHRRLFRELHPPSCVYYVGHYRGESYRCLRHYAVIIRSDPLVGASPGTVSGLMAELAVAIRADLAGFDAALSVPSVQMPNSQKVLYIVTLACRIFVNFLSIHPYANGNGHMARFSLVAILARYGLGLTNWAVDPRPPDPPYSELIYKHRRGDTAPLEAAVLRQCVPIDPWPLSVDSSRAMA
jgi:hypothetical protein